MDSIYKYNRQARLVDFDKINEEAKERGLLLVIDNNKDGVANFANYNKSFLSRKLNASGFVTVFFIVSDFVPISQKVKDNVLFVSEYEYEKQKVKDNEKT
jgi:hypothetical protein